MGKPSQKRSHRTRSRSRSPSRHRERDYDELYREIKRLKKEVRRGRHSRSEDRQTPSDGDDNHQHQAESYYRCGFYEDHHRRKSRSRSTIPSGSGSSDKENDNDDNQSELITQDSQEERKDNAPEEDPLDEEELLLLGEKAAAGDSGELDLHREIGDRWQVWSQEGLKKDKKQELLEEYPRKGKFHFEAPALNPEVEAIINESVKKRDKFFCIDQNTIGSAISALGTGTSLLLCHKTEENFRTRALKCCLDAGKLLSELYYQVSKTRKAFIYPGLDKKAKEILEKSKTDTNLYGNELSTRLKTAKSMEKVGLTLKPQTVAKKTPFKPSPSGNWKAASGKNQGYSQTGYKSKGYRHRGSQHGRYQQDQGQASAPRPQNQTWPRDNRQQATQK